MDFNKDSLEQANEHVLSVYGDDVRAVAYAFFPEDKYEILYMRDDVREEYAEGDGIEIIYEEKVADWFFKHEDFPGELKAEVDFYDTWTSVTYYISGVGFFISFEPGTIDMEHLNEIQEGLWE